MTGVPNPRRWPLHPKPRAYETLEQYVRRLAEGYDIHYDSFCLHALGIPRHDRQAQRAALRAAGCHRLYEEKISGARRDRPELARLLDHLREGDVVMATRLDRLARSTRDLLDLAESLNRAGAGLRSLAEPWADTTSPAGKMVLTVFAGIAEFERALIAERTHVGRRAAQEKGVRFGRPPVLSAEQVALGQRLLAEGTSVREAARVLRCHHATLYRALQTRAPAPEIYTSRGHELRFFEELEPQG